MKLSQQAIRQLSELDEASREAVRVIVNGHIRACRSNGFMPENMERVYLEAIEIVRLEGPEKPAQQTQAKSHEPARRYEQYYRRV